VTALYRAAQYVESARTVSSNDAATKLPLGFDQAPALGTAVYVLRMLGESEQNGGYSIEARPTMRMRAEFIRWTRRASGQIDR